MRTTQRSRNRVALTLPIRERWRIATILVALALTACDGDESVNDPPDEDPNAYYSFDLAHDSLAVKTGATGVTTLRVTRTASFKGQVSFAAVDPPAGISIAIGPVAEFVESYPVTVHVAATVAPGSYTLTIRGTTPNKPDQTNNLTLVVSLSQYRLALEPSTLFIPRGAQGFVLVSTFRDPGFVGQIALTAAGAPDGMTVTIGTSTSDTRVMLIAVSSSVSTGSYEIVIRATTPNRPDQTVALTLIVEPSAPGGNTTVRFCGLRPIFFAAQDGDATWRPVAGNAETYSFDITMGRGAFAFVIPLYYVGGGVAFETYMFYGTQAELNVFSAPCSTANLGSVSGSVVNGGADAKVALGLWATRQVANFVLPLQRPLWDLVAWSSDVYGRQATKAIIRRGLSLPGGSSLPVLDFRSAEAFDLVSRELTIPSVSGIQYLAVDFRTRNGTDVPIMCYDFVYNYQFCSVSSHDTYPGVPSPSDGDVHRFSLSTGDGAITTCYKEATSRSLSLPPELGPVDNSTIAATPSPRFRARYTRQSQFNGGAQITYANREPTFVSRLVEINIAAGYLGQDPIVEMTMPDFSLLTGWSDHWGLSTNPSFRFEARGWTDAPGSGAAACGGEFSPFGRDRPDASQVHFAWTSTQQGAPEQNAIRPIHGGWTRGQEVIRGLPLGGNTRR